MAGVLSITLSLILPFGLMCYFMCGYLTSRGWIGDLSTVKARRVSQKELRQAHKKKQLPHHPVLKRWLFFGGGFYGLMALYTYIWVEAADIGRFCIAMLDPANWTFALTLDLLIKLLINTVTNWLICFGWPVYWVAEAGTTALFAGFLGAYLAYTVAARLASLHAQQGRGHMQLWSRLKARRERRQAAQDPAGTP